MTYIMRYEHSAVCTLSESRKANEARWRMANKRICISNEMFGEWRQLREELCPFKTTIYSFAICYRIVLHMKLPLSMEG